MKILFVCRALDNIAGGVERQVTSVMNEMSCRGHKVCLLTWDNSEAKSFYDMNPDIEWLKMNIADYRIPAGIFLKIRRMMYIRKKLKEQKPDVVVGFQQGPIITTVLSGLGLHIPMIASERMSLSFMKYSKKRFLNLILFRLMFLATEITVQFSSYIKDYPEYLRNKITVMPNPVRKAEGYAEPGESQSGEFTLLSVGRLSSEKNFDVLINAFVSIADEFPDWKLVIAGDGTEREKLNNFVRQTGIENRISLPGNIKDVASLYKQSHLFCLPSRWEGFPNALSEALSHGLPCVGFAECTGVRDLIENGKNGLLADGVGNAVSLVGCLRKLMSDKELRVGLGKEGVKSIGQYSPEKVFDMWENLFSEFREK